MFRIAQVFSHCFDLLNDLDLSLGWKRAQILLAHLRQIFLS